MSESQITIGGVPSTGGIVAVDETTIAGTGAARDPLRCLIPAYPGVMHDDTLTGNGTVAHPLSVAVVATPTSQLPNGESAPMVPGQPIASVGGFARLAGASSQAIATVIGLVLIGADTTLPVTISLVGPLTLTTDQWDAITGQFGGLSPGAAYYLDPTAGLMTTTPPTDSGKYLVEIGHALTAETMAVLPSIPVLL